MLMLPRISFKIGKRSGPGRERKIIGSEFIRVFEEEARKLKGIDFLAQGTIYPDIIESGTKTANASNHITMWVAFPKISI